MHRQRDAHAFISSHTSTQGIIRHVFFPYADKTANPFLHQRKPPLAKNMLLPCFARVHAHCALETGNSTNSHTLECRPKPIHHLHGGCEKK